MSYMHETTYPMLETLLQTLKELGVITVIVS
jgi:hypothetical protein